MTTAGHSTVVGTFADRTQAEHALDELRQVGFSDDQVGFSAGNEFEGEHKKQADDDTKKQSAQVGPIVVVVRADNRQEEVSNILQRNGASNISSHAQAERKADANVPGREYDPILGPTLVGEEDMLPIDYSGFGMTRDPALDAEPTPVGRTGDERIHQETQEQEAQLSNADTGSWKDPNVKNPSIR
jgi:hypothetical protein